MSPLAVILTLLSFRNRLFLSKGHARGVEPTNLPQTSIAHLQFRLKDSIEVVRALELAPPNITEDPGFAELIHLAGEIRGQLERLQTSTALLNSDHSRRAAPPRRRQRMKRSPATHVASPERRIACRLLEQGLSCEQVALKTMLPLETVRQLEALRRVEEPIDGVASEIDSSSGQTNPVARIEIERTQILL